MKINWIKNKEELLESIKIWKKEKYLSLDTEFIRETSFFPKIALIQVATEKESWLLDPLALSKEEIKPFLALLVQPKILKVMHASFADQECFYWSYGVIATPVIDTAVAGALLGLGDNIGLSRLLKEKLGVHIPKGYTRAKWLERPLPSQLETYAAEDVIHLVKLAKILEQQLKKLKRWEWALEESEVHKEEIDVSPLTISEKLGRSSTIEKKDYGVLIELVQWREKRAREANIPRNWITDNETLMSIAKVKPKSIDRLFNFRGLKKKDIERSGEKIIEAIHIGEKWDGHFPKTDSGLRNPDSSVVSFIQTYLGLLSEEKKIAQRLLITSHKVNRLVQLSKKPISIWVKEGVLTKRASELIGKELKLLLSGKIGLTLKGEKLKIQKI